MGGSGSTTLPSQATNSSSLNQGIQVSEAFTINDHAVNETRISFNRGTSTGSSVSSAPSVQVNGYFSEGGSGQQSSSSTQTSLEIQNLTTLSIRAHALKLGTRIRYNKQSTNSSSGFNGSFSFNTLQEYLNLKSDLAAATANNIPLNTEFATIAAACTQAECDLPSNLSYSYAAGATTFSSTIPGFGAGMVDTAFFLQDDWKINRFLTFSAGLRWENQTQVSDNKDIGPRVAIAYALDGHKKGKTSKTVVRLGYGFFYDRFQLGNVLNVIRQNGTASSIMQVSINNPTCYDEAASRTSHRTPAHCPAQTIAAPAEFRRPGSVTEYKLDRPDRAQLSFADHRAVQRQPGAPDYQIDFVGPQLPAFPRRASDGDHRCQSYRPDHADLCQRPGYRDADERCAVRLYHR